MWNLPTIPSCSIERPSSGPEAYNGGAPKDLFQAIAGSTACSLMVFSGLLAWASLDAHRPLKEEI